jgi:FMN phosphatase YigB (HAD superfamily)
MIKAVLWDIGGPINDETLQEARFDDAALAAAREVRDVSAEEYLEVCRAAVESYAPRAYRYILWQLARGELGTYETLRRRVTEIGYEHFQVRPEVPGLLAEQAARFKLGMVANSGESMLERLSEHGLLQYFSSRKPGALLGLEKPDVRYFQAVLAELGARPEEAVMIGDRIDCDVAPARTLGLTAIRLRTGRHRHQRPRYPEEAPDMEIDNIEAIREVMTTWQT